MPILVRLIPLEISWRLSGTVWAPRNSFLQSIIKFGILPSSKAPTSTTDFSTKGWGNLFFILLLNLEMYWKLILSCFEGESPVCKMFTSVYIRKSVAINESSNESYFC